MQQNTEFTEILQVQRNTCVHQKFGAYDILSVESSLFLEQKSTERCRVYTNAGTQRSFIPVFHCRGAMKNTGEYCRVALRVFQYSVTAEVLSLPVRNTGEYCRVALTVFQYSTAEVQ